MGIETAIIGSAILGAGASAMGASKQAKAAKSAASAQTDASNQQMALQKEIYYDQRGLQQPYYQAGLQGLYGQSGIMDLLGKSGGGQAATGNAMAPQAANQNYASGNYGVAQIGQPTPQSGPNWGAYLQANPDVANYFRSNPAALAKFGGDINKAAEYHYNTFGKGEGRQLPQYSQPAQTGNALAQTTGQVGTAQPANVNGPATPTAPADPTEGPMTQTLRQTPGYQFLQDESKRQIENSFAQRGKLLSGSAMNALNDRTLGIADQTYQQSVNNNFNLANIGMGAAAQIQGAGAQYGANAGNALANIGQAKANSAYGQADAWNAGAQGVGNAIAGGIGAYGAYSGWGNGSAGNAAPAQMTGTYNGVF
jgi:hypothetical protein